jgi:hypothetical protein
MAGAPPVPYDPTANQATLTDQPDGWYLWLARPDAAPAELHLFSRNEVGDAILDVNLSDQMKVIAYFEGVLAGVGSADGRLPRLLDVGARPELGQPRSPGLPSAHGHAPARRPLRQCLRRRSRRVLEDDSRPSGTGHALQRNAVVDRPVVRPIRRPLVAGVELRRPSGRTDGTQGVWAFTLTSKLSWGTSSA